MNRLPFVLLVWLGCTFAWVVLGTSLVARTGRWSGSLAQEVRKLWGPPLEQGPPCAFYRAPRRLAGGAAARATEGRVGATTPDRIVEDSIPVPLEASTLDVRLELEHRRKGLLWFPTYDVEFAGRYAFVNPNPAETAVTVRFPLGTESAVYDGFEVRDAANRVVAATFRADGAEWTRAFAPGERREFAVRYRARGTSSWSCRLTQGTGQARNFRLAAATNFANVDFPPGSISPSRQERAGGAWRGEWTFGSLVANATVGIVLPERLNPGPLAAKITFFAPVGLLFFLFVVAIVAAAQGKDIHPMNTFFIGCAFFAFHLLFAYLVDHLAIPPSFAIASLVSIFLVVSYARLFTGWSFALQPIGLAQLVYLVLFSVTFFWEGYTGLAITIGAVLTLFVMMQYTGRVDWSRSRAAGAPRV